MPVSIEALRLRLTGSFAKRHAHRVGETRRQRQTADAVCPISCELNFGSYLMSLTLPALKVTFMSW